MTRASRVPWPWRRSLRARLVAYFLLLSVLAFLLWRTLTLLLRLLLRLVDEAHEGERAGPLWRQLMIALWRQRR